MEKVIVERVGMPTDKMYHTDLRPVSKNGLPIKPLDLVLVGDIPEQYWNEEGSQRIKEYQGSFGLVTYFNDEGGYYSPLYMELPYHLGWVRPEGNDVNVRCHHIFDDEVLSYDFWLPANSLIKIPYNSLIMIFLLIILGRWKKLTGLPQKCLFVKECPSLSISRRFWKRLMIS